MMMMMNYFDPIYWIIFFLYQIMQHFYVRERDNLKLSENLALTPWMFVLILNKLPTLEADKLKANTHSDVVSNIRAFVNFDFATIEPEPDCGFELDMKLVYSR